MIKIKKDIAVSETGFLFDPNTGESFTLNKTGKLIFKLLAEENEPESISKIVEEQYDIDNQTAQRYVDEFIMMLQQFNLIGKDEV